MEEKAIKLISKIIGLALVLVSNYFLGFEVTALIVLTAIYQQMPEKDKY